MHWVSDGSHRIACFESREFRFYRNGISRRRNWVTARYLKGIVPIRPSGIAINFGAHIGEVAITLADMGVEVLAIEPDPNVLPLLRANTVGRTIDVVPVAAWHNDGQIDMYIASETADTSVFNISPDKRRLQCLTIDGIVADREIDHVDLILGDAEGAEPEVLAGAFLTLAMTDYVSVCASAERNGQTTAHACEKILRDAGFDILHREDHGFCILIAKNRRC